MKKSLLFIFVLALMSMSSAIYAQSCQGNYLSTSGNKLVDSNGNEVQLTGVNWFGFETSALVFHGLWNRDHKSMLQQIKDQGFNCIRVPWCNKILEGGVALNISSYGSDPYTGVSPMNEEEATKTLPIEIMDIMVQWCQDNNMKIILDNHSRKPDGYLSEELWYTADVSHEKWISDWVFMAERYKDYDAVIAMDINNEPHGKNGNGSRWGTGNPSNDWRLAAQDCGNAILEANPNVLIMVEGIEEFGEDVYWWGGNLIGAEQYPVVLNNPNKLVYSPHEYGPTVYPQPWFSDPDFPSNMAGIWEKHFNYLFTNGTSPLFFGEFGIRELGGVDEVWFDTFLSFLAQSSHHWTFWCWNPNSGDTGGILANDWATIVDWKMDKLRPYLAAEIPNCKGAEVVNVENVTLTPSSINLCKGEGANLTVQVLPTNASNKSVTYASSNTVVVTVNTMGALTAIAAGNAQITVTTLDGGFTDVTTVNVTNCNIPVTDITLSETLLELEKGYNSSLIATIAPANATDKTATWGSSDEAVAAVSSSGLVTAIAEGEATITATSSNPAIKATCKVTVTEMPDKQQAYPNGTPHAIPGTIKSVNYDMGGEGIAYHDANVGNKGPGPRQDENVDTEYKITAGNVGWIASGEWLEYTVNVGETGAYNFEVLVASTGNNGAYHIEFNGVDKTGIQNVDATGGWATFVPQTIENVQLSVGEQVMRIYMDGGSFNIGTLTITPSGTVDTYTLSTDVNGSGSIDLSPAAGVYNSGTIVTATAIAETGWHFVNWSNAASGSNSEVDITMNANISLTANFEIDNITDPCDNPTPISVSFSHNGSGKFCWVTSDNISYINSWNTDAVQINGVDFTNAWANSLPARINGSYYISYEGAVNWSHFEAVGSAKNASLATSSQSKQANAKVKVYPNPAKNKLNLSNIESFGVVKIYNNLGKQVLVSETNGAQMVEISIAYLDAGTYIIVLSATNGNQSIKKLLIE
ncbi:MAG: cellulase family glycosylhydrolase [Salinivirgaceae bacterium]|jgi:endoglucanase|nr:cellulase family glycosylhydrolase [Salinivirgaceae bacterium]